ncbi:MAG: hypothetical protein WBW62_10560, partial [Solirubrobacterales bacterium]
EPQGSGSPSDDSGIRVVDVSPPSKPKLVLKMNRSKLSGKPGRLKHIRLRIKNTGSAPARNVETCVHGPKRLVKLRRPCVRRKSLKPNSAMKVVLPVKIRRTARPGKSARLRVRTRGDDLRVIRSTVRIKVF